MGQWPANQSIHSFITRERRDLVGQVRQPTKVSRASVSGGTREGLSVNLSKFRAEKYVVARVGPRSCPGLHRLEFVVVLAVVVACYTSRGRGRCVRGRGGRGSSCSSSLYG